MSKSRTFVAAVLLATLAMPASAALTWNPWSVGSAAPVVAGDGSVTFQVGDTGAAVWSTNQTRSKDFYSTSYFNGSAMGSLAGASIEYTITAPGSLVSPPGNGLAGPYVNIVVTDGTGGYAFLLLDASPAPLGQQFHDFSSARYSFNEVHGTMAAFVAGLGAPDLVIGSQNFFDFSDVASLTIASGGFAANPSSVTPTPGGWIGFGTTDSFAFVLGNRGSSPTPEVTINGVALVPEPGSLALLGLGLAGLAAVRRRKR